jgi:hypothetical protein
MDRETIDVFYNPIKHLFDVLIPDAQASLRNELKNYNDFMRIFYKTKLREKLLILAQHDRQQARAATKGTKMTTNAKTKFMKLGLTEAQANAEIAKTMAFAKTAVPNVAQANPAANAAVDARVIAALNDLMTKIDRLPVRSDLLRATRTAKIGLATAMNQYTRQTKGAMPANNSDVNAYLANLQAKQYANMASRMPTVPTTVPKIGGRKTRRSRKTRNKTRRV